MIRGVLIFLVAAVLSGMVVVSIASTVENVLNSIVD